jgi:predicted enzyme related to lactoylglutathione lyase
VRFYEEVFVWRVQKWEGPMDYWLVTTGGHDEPAIEGAITPRANAGGTQNTIGVRSVDEYTQRVVEGGGKVVAPKVTVPGVGYVAYCADTEGTVFGIMEDDPSAQ